MVFGDEVEVASVPPAVSATNSETAGMNESGIFWHDQREKFYYRTFYEMEASAEVIQRAWRLAAPEVKKRNRLKRLRDYIAQEKAEQRTLERKSAVSIQAACRRLMVRLDLPRRLRERNREKNIRERRLNEKLKAQKHKRDAKERRKHAAICTLRRCLAPRLRDGLLRKIRQRKQEVKEDEAARVSQRVYRGYRSRVAAHSLWLERHRIRKAFVRERDNAWIVRDVLWNISVAIERIVHKLQPGDRVVAHWSDLPALHKGTIIGVLPPEKRNRRVWTREHETLCIQYDDGVVERGVFRKNVIFRGRPGCNSSDILASRRRSELMVVGPAKYALLHGPWKRDAMERMSKKYKARRETEARLGNLFAQLASLNQHLVDSGLRRGLVAMQVIVGERPNKMMASLQSRRRANGLSWMRMIDDQPLSLDRKGPNQV